MLTEVLHQYIGVKRVFKLNPEVTCGEASSARVWECAGVEVCKSVLEVG